MKQARRSVFFFAHLDALIAATAGFFIIYMFTRHGGIGISPDSVEYMSTAQNFYAGEGLVNFNKLPLEIFPCFYPVFLSSGIFITRHDVMQFAPVLNGLLFATLIYLCGLVLRRFDGNSKIYRWILLSCIALSPCLLEVYSMLWSETVFLLLVLLFILSLRAYFQSHSFYMLLAASFVAALAFITRYAGITVVGTGGLLLLLDPSVKLPKRIRNAFVFGLVSCSLLALNLVRNRIATGTLTGHREKGITPVWQNMHHYGAVFCDWLPFLKNCNGFAPWLALIVIGGFAYAWYIYFFKKKVFSSYEYVLVSFFLVYSLFIILSATISRYETINSRLLSPAFLPFLLGATAWIPGKIKGLSKSTGIWTTAIALFVAVSFQYNQATADYETYDGVKDAGIPGYTEDQWTKSPTVLFMEQHLELLQQAVVYSNANDAVYFFTHLDAQQLPHKDSPEEIGYFKGEHHGWIILFNDGDNQDLASLERVQALRKITPFRQFEDGAVYVFPDSTAMRFTGPVLNK